MNVDDIYLSLNRVSLFLVERLVKFVEARFTMSTDQQQKDYHFIISLIIYYFNFT